jgi:hypothetical protein
MAWAAMGTTRCAADIKLPLVATAHRGLSELRKQRRDAIAAELARTFYSVDFGDAVTLLRAVPDHCPPDELRAEQSQPAYVAHRNWRA